MTFNRLELLQKSYVVFFLQRFSGFSLTLVGFPLRLLFRFAIDITDGRSLEILSTILQPYDRSDTSPQLQNARAVDSVEPYHLPYKTYTMI
jgi:hypothetical protein